MRSGASTCPGGGATNAQRSKYMPRRRRDECAADNEGRRRVQLPELITAHLVNVMTKPPTFTIFESTGKQNERPMTGKKMRRGEHAYPRSEAHPNNERPKAALHVRLPDDRWTSTDQVQATAWSSRWQARPTTKSQDGRLHDYQEKEDRGCDAPEPLRPWDR
jgi:hypothetical protein